MTDLVNWWFVDLVYGGSNGCPSATRTPVEVTVNQTPATQASNITFSAVANTQMDISWTNGSGTKRAVFIKQASSGTASPVDGTTYTANTTFGNSGSQIGSSGWYCIYNGTGSTVTVTGLTQNTAYQVHVCEYNGAAGSEVYNTSSATNNPKSQTTAMPTIFISGSFSAFTSCVGSVSSAQSFTASGTHLTANIAITAPTGFEVSTSSGSGYSGSISLTQSGGSVSSTTVYVRLTNAASGTPSGNVSLTSTGATTQNLTVSGTVNPPTVISSQSTDAQTKCLNGTFTAISVTATGTGFLTYQWFSNTIESNTGGTSLGSANGAQTNSYTPQASTAGTLYYYCVVTGTCGTATSIVSGAFIVSIVYPNIPIVGTITQTTCTSATGSVELSGLPNGNWTVNPGLYTGSTNSTIVAGLTAGTYNFTVANSAGCSSTGTADVVINVQPISPAPIIIGAISQPTCDQAAGTIVLNGLPSGNWIINPGPYTGSGSSMTVYEYPGATYNFTVTNDIGCTSTPTSVTLMVQPATPATPIVSGIVQPSCTLATGSVTLSNLPSGNWTIYPGSITGSTSSTTISGLAAGYYSFTVTNNVGCPSLFNEVIINPQPLTPAAPSIGTIVQPTCAIAAGSVVLNGLPASGSWTINPDGLVGAGTSVTIPNLATGTYNFTVTNSGGCGSAASNNVVINIQPIFTLPTAPIVGTITQPTCTVSTGDVVLNGLPATGSWTINPGGIIGTGVSRTITGLATGSYNFTVTNANGCISDSSTTVVINAQAVTPSAPSVLSVIQPNCNIATASVVLIGLPSVGTWTINPGGITGSGTSYTISGLASGSYNFTVTNPEGCTSMISSTVVINPQLSTTPPSAPVIGTTTQATCFIHSGSTYLNQMPSTGTWTLTTYPSGTTTTGTGTSVLISNMAPGTYNYTVMNSYGCVSALSSSVVINALPETPASPTLGPITHPTCQVSTGSVILFGLPSNGTWIVTRVQGGITTTGTGTNWTISGLPIGTYNFTVANSSGCVSAATSNVVINPQPASAPMAPVVSSITQPTCSVSTGSVLLTGLSGSGPWTLIRTPGLTTTAGSGTSKTIIGLTPGTYSFTITDVSGCVSLSSVDIVINPQPATAPSAPIIGTILQPNCTISTGSVVLNGLPITGTWTLTNIPSGIFTTGTGPSFTISGLGSGTYAYAVTVAPGCTSVPSANVTINAALAIPTTPSIGTVTQPTCAIATGTVVLNSLPATGTWTLTRIPGGIITTGTGASKTITGLAAGTYTYTVTNANGCISDSSTNVVINAQPATPIISVGTITQPTYALSTGSVVLNGLPASGTWTLTRTQGSVTTTGMGVSTTISGLPAGTYSYKVTSAAGCVSAVSANIVITAQPVAIAAPTVGAITQPTCSVATGSVTLSGLPTTGAWTLTRTPGAVVTTGTGVSKTITLLATGTYTYTVANSSGIVSGASANVIINAQPTATTVPTVGVITQPTCGVSTGSVVLNGLPAVGTWTLTRTPGSIVTGGSGSSITISGLLAGTYTYKVTSSGFCVSASSANIAISAQPATPTKPVVGTITQPTCTIATGSVVLNGLPLGSWTINPGGITGTANSKTITALAAGTYSYTVKNAAGCTSLGTTNIVINPQPITPTAPIVGTIVQPTYTVATGSVNLNGLPLGTWAINPGAFAGSTVSTTISSLVSGTYNYTVMNSIGCVSPASIVVINKQPTTQGFGPQGSNSGGSTAGINEDAKDIVIMVSPNPSDGKFIINVSGINESLSMNIYNMSGQIVFTEQLPDAADLINKPIDLKSYPKGMYFIRLITKNYSYIEKIIVE